MARTATPDLAAAGRAGRQTEESADPLAGLVFAALVLACFGAFFLTQRLKHTPTVVQRIMMNRSFTPGPSGLHRVEHLSFRIARADEVTIAVVSLASGAVVATLRRNVAVPRYHQFRLAWDGRTGTPEAPGPTAPPGDYRMRVTLRRQGRAVNAPRTFRLLAPAAPTTSR